MKRLGAFFILIASHSAFAEGVDPPECSVRPQPAEEVIPSDLVSGNYWTNMMGDDIVMFTNVGGGTGRFQAFDLKNKLPIRLTSGIDPFPAPDGRHMYIHPSSIRFFEYDTIKERVDKGEDPRVLSDYKYKDATLYENKEKKNGARFIDRDPAVAGYYQSLGTLESVKTEQDNHSTYRVLTGAHEGAIKDYKVTYGPNDEILNVEVAAPAVRLCPNLRTTAMHSGDLEFDTPIISPKGDEFAVMNRRTQTTVIYKFDPKSGVCEQVLDLGIPAGKIHFSQDGSQIAFHSSKLSQTTGIQKPYLYDRKTQELKSLDVGDPNDGAQGTYPAFRQDGKIVYQRTRLDRSTGKASKDWVIIDPKKLSSIKIPLGADPTVCSLPALTTNVQSLLKLWKDICKDAAQKQNGALWALTIDTETCKKLVSNAANINAEDRATLLAACPSGRTVPEKGAEFTRHGADQLYPALVENRCAICHTQGSPHGYIPFDDPEAMRAMKAIGGSAAPGKPFEGKTFLEQVEKILNENVAGHRPHRDIPVVPADGDRLKPAEISEILDWMKNGQKGHYTPPVAAPATGSAH